MKNETLFNESCEATYCPEDNKIRLYVGRVDREEFLALRKEGWTSTPKQDCDFVATWTTKREDTALSYAGYLGDEDQGPAERAADRAERFASYRDKRTSEALDYADSYDQGARVHGRQDYGKAVKAADRHDRQADRALTQWSKAEYWTGRTSGVISNALHLGSPSVRLGRIKKLETKKRKHEKSLEDYKKRFGIVLKLFKEAGNEGFEDRCLTVFGFASFRANYQHPRPEDCGNSYIKENGSNLYRLLTCEGPISGKEACELFFTKNADPASESFKNSSFVRWGQHFENRLAYENQMIEAEGGSAGEEEMRIGGLWDRDVISKINKSNASGKITSIEIIVQSPKKIRRDVYQAGDVVRIKIERSLSGSYSEPTDESLEILRQHKADTKARKQAKPKAPSLINPTDADAKRLQAIWNKNASERSMRGTYGKGKDRTQPQEVVEMTQAQYSARSGGSYSPCETIFLSAGGAETRTHYYKTVKSEAACKIRKTGGGDCYTANAHRVIVITDKPQNPLPPQVWEETKETVKS